MKMEPSKGNEKIRTRLTITDNAYYQVRVSLFGRTHASDGVYAVAKLMRGDLVALDRTHTPMGFVVGNPAKLWEELMRHPAKIQHETGTNFTLSAGITHADAIWFDLDKR
jgi:hypothetical protein